MAYRFQKNSISGEAEMIIDGFEKGIAQSAYMGPQDIRNINLISTPQEAPVNYAMSALTLPPTVSAVAFTCADATNLITVSSTSGYYNGLAITINTVSGGTGLSTSVVYWVGNLSGNTFKLYKNPGLNAGQVIDITADGSGTLSTYTVGTFIDKAVAYNAGSFVRNYEFLLDSNGRVWWINNAGGTLTTNLTYLGNTTLTSSAGGRGLQVFQGYIIVFRQLALDSLGLSSIEGNVDVTTAGWSYAWASINTSTQTTRATISGRDNVLYYALDASALGSVLVNAGKTFDPTDGTTFTRNNSALTISGGDYCLSLAELGTNLLVGSTSNCIYVWDRISTTYNSFILVAENRISKMVTSNASTYIFAGNRGRIYITNGANVDLYYKVPDSILNLEEPYFTWIDAIYWRNQLYFTFSATDNAGTVVSTVTGLWAIDLATDVFRYTNQFSYGGYGGTAGVTLPNIVSTNPAGGGLYSTWINSGTVGVDVSTTIPYTGTQPYIITEIIPIGTYLTKKTFSNIEFKLGKPTVSGESVTIAQRSNLSDSFTTVGTTTTAGVLSDAYPMNFENVQWIQWKITLTSTASSPSLLPLRELIVR